MHGGALNPTPFSTVLAESSGDRADKSGRRPRCALEVAHWLAWVVVDVRVRVAAGRVGALVTAERRQTDVDGLDVVAVEVGVRELLTAARWRGDALVVVWVPWLAEEAVRAAGRAGAVSAGAVRWCGACRRLRLWLRWLRLRLRWDVVDDPRDSADKRAPVADRVLEVARRAAGVAVDERVGDAAVGVLAFVAALRRLDAVDGLDVIAVEVDVGELRGTVRRHGHALEEACVPWLAVVVVGAARGAVIGAAFGVRRVVACADAGEKRGRERECGDGGRGDAGLGVARRGNHDLVTDLVGGACGAGGANVVAAIAVAGGYLPG
ncbi:hypothetical protein PINS_up002161 [Pythium insidiosum]|nr:hypothetical protein PINS_up002161 [Pythium insidiosum]